VRWTDGRCVPEGIVDIPAPWVLDIAVPILAAAVLMVMVVDALRRRRLTWWLLISVTSASCWWLETFGDWGQHLSYSPEFHHYVLGWPKTAPHNPLWMPLMYAVYWVAHAWAILRLAQWLQRRRGVGLGTGILVLSVPVTWVWNLVIEGFAAYMGWWTYQPPIGPYIDMGRGNWPLLWPMLVLFGWINLIAWMVGPPEDEIGCNRLERMFRLDRLLARPGWSRAGGATVDTPAGDVLTRTAAAVTTDPGLGTWRFQLVRFLAWAAFFQATFVLTLDLPLVALRTLTGWDTPFS
jgi:hypothetical protein